MRNWCFFTVYWAFSEDAFFLLFSSEFCAREKSILSSPPGFVKKLYRGRPSSPAKAPLDIIVSHLFCFCEPFVQISRTLSHSWDKWIRYQCESIIFREKGDWVKIFLIKSIQWCTKSPSRVSGLEALVYLIQYHHENNPR